MATLLEKLQEYAKEIGRIKSDGQYPWIFDTDPPTLDNSPPMIRLLNYFTEEQIITFLQDNKTNISIHDLLCITTENFYWREYKRPFVEELFSVFVESLKRLEPEDVESLNDKIAASISSFRNTKDMSVITHLIQSDDSEALTTIRKHIRDAHWNKLLQSCWLTGVLKNFGVKKLIQILDTIPNESDKLTLLQQIYRSYGSDGTILHWAAQNWNGKGISTVLSQLTKQSNREILLDMINTEKATPIMCAAIYGRANVFKEFFDMIPDQSKKLIHLKKTYKDNTLLHWATKPAFLPDGTLWWNKAKLGIISTILDACPDDNTKIKLLNTPNKEGDTPIDYLNIILNHTHNNSTKDTIKLILEGLSSTAVISRESIELRAKDQLSRGHHTAVASLQYLDALKKGAPVDMNEINRHFLNEIIEESTYKPAHDYLKNNPNLYQSALDFLSHHLEKLQGLQTESSNTSDTKSGIKDPFTRKIKQTTDRASIQANINKIKQFLQVNSGDLAKKNHK